MFCINNNNNHNNSTMTPQRRVSWGTQTGVSRSLPVLTLNECVYWQVGDRTKVGCLSSTTHTVVSYHNHNNLIVHDILDVTYGPKRWFDNLGFNLISIKDVNSYVDIIQVIFLYIYFFFFFQLIKMFTLGRISKLSEKTRRGRLPTDLYIPPCRNKHRKEK